MRGFTRGNNLMDQAMKMQAKLEQVRKQIAEMEFTGEAGGGAVKVVINGENKVLKVSIDPAAVDVDDLGMLEDLIVLATNNAVATAKETSDKVLSSQVRLPPGFGF